MLDKTAKYLLSEEDHLLLSATIIETDASAELFQNAQKSMEIQPSSLKVIMTYYLSCLKTHKTLWDEILIKTVGEELASSYFNNWKYDVRKRTVFFLEHGHGCSCSI